MVYIGKLFLKCRYGFYVYLFMFIFVLYTACVVHAFFLFYFKENIRCATRRVVLASLYIGIGPLEQDLVGFN